MNFKNWISYEDRVDKLIQNIVDHNINVFDLINESGVAAQKPSFLGWFRNKMGQLGQGAVNLGKGAVKAFGDELNAWNPRNYDWGWSKKNTAPVQPQQSPDQRLADLHSQLMNHRGSISNSHGPEWEAEHNKLKSQIRDLGRQVAPQEYPPSNPHKVDMDKASRAIEVLRSVLSDKSNQDILSHLEQEVAKMGKPNHYNNMSSGEQDWYNKLGNDERQKFDSEMEKTGNQNINQGDEWWQVTANRAGKAAQQGYHDADANWKWASGFANRQRIRRSMNPEWEKSLQGESLTPGGKLFREWLLKREDATAGNAGVDANTPNNVMSPTDPKEIARRKAVNDLTSTIMKKNPKLKPGATDQNTVANLTATDPMLSKADPATQQAVSSFFLKQ